MTTVPTIDRLDCQRLAGHGSLARVECHDMLASTQDRAHELARDPAAGPLPLLIAAEEQTAGRGRGTNRWWTGRGSLAFSLLFDPADWGLAPQALPVRSLVVGVAIVDTLQPLLAGYALGLHWPNDVFVADKKLAGILIDVLPGGRHIVGIGLNVNNTLDGAPEEVRGRATSLAELTGRPFDRTTLLVSLMATIEDALRTAGAEPEAFGRRFERLCLQLGRELTIDSGSRTDTGRCAGIASDGALVLETAQGRKTFYSGALR
jgi:BirA family biotin operon repressor/biotin-[acetyl-CoA-carboxylase] ligase